MHHVTLRQFPSGKFQRFRSRAKLRPYRIDLQYGSLFLNPEKRIIGRQCPGRQVAYLLEQCPPVRKQPEIIVRFQAAVKLIRPVGNVHGQKSDPDRCQVVTQHLPHEAVFTDLKDDPQALAFGNCLPDQLDRRARVSTGLVFIAAGIYLSLTHVYGLPAITW